MQKSDFKEKSSEELMLIYQQESPEDAYRAFTLLYDRFHQKVYSYLLSKLKSHADADDLLQKIFLKVHESKHLFKDKYKFEQWIFVIAKTAVLDHFRSSSRFQNRLNKFEVPEANVDNSDVSLNINGDQRELLEMKFIDELSYQEMSAILNRPETALRKMVSRLMGNLKKGDV